MAQRQRRRRDWLLNSGGRAITHEAGTLRRREPYWQAQAAVACALALYLFLPAKLILGPRWLIPALEALLLLGLILSTPATDERSPLRRRTSLLLIALVSAANAFSLILLVHFLLKGAHETGRELIFSSIDIWVTNVLIFGLWYWEMDRGGPARRGTPAQGKPDFLFPQMASEEIAPKGWCPEFIDYLYVGFTNATAFSPTDAMPLSKSVKLVMTFQALISLLTVVLVGARAVNILS